VDPTKSTGAVSQSPMTVPPTVKPVISQPAAEPLPATSTATISRTPETAAVTVPTPEPLNRASAGNIPTTSSPAGKMDLSQFLGLHHGDSYNHVVELFGKPITEKLVKKGGSIAYFGYYQRPETSFTVLFDAQHSVKGVDVHDPSPGTAMYARRVAPSDPLLDLIGRSESEIVRVLGRPDDTPSDGVLIHLLHYPYRLSGTGLSIDFWKSDGKCHSISLRWEQ